MASSAARGLHIYRYGESARLPGLSVGVARFLPRGVAKADYASGGYFDVWLPLLAPSKPLIAAFKSGRIAFPAFARRYRAEMRDPAVGHVIALVAAVARRQRVNLGCYCANPNACHRSVLRDLVDKAAAGLPDRAHSSAFSSPACSMPEIED